MEKYSNDIQSQISTVLESISIWKDLFYIRQEFYIDGYSIILDEDVSYPRRIVIFKKFEGNYSIKSFEINHEGGLKAKQNEIYSVSDIKEIKSLIKELRSVIYGKDLINSVSCKLRKYF